MNDTAGVATPARRLAFARIGGFDQVVIASGRDIEAIAALDEKLWVALAMPASTPGLPAETLALLDSDGDGRIRVPEIRASIEFCRSRLTDLSILLSPGDSIPLASIRDDPLREAAWWILSLGGKTGSTDIGLSDLETANALFDAQPFNGDGIVVADSAGDDEEARDLLRTIVESTGGTADASGKPGVDRNSLGTFETRAREFLSWHDDDSRATAPGPFAGSDDAGRLAHAVAAFGAVKAKLDDYYLRCGLSALGDESASFPAGKAEIRENLLKRDLAADDPDLAALPLAKVRADGILPLAGPFNPAWQGRMERFIETVILPLHPERPECLDAGAWARIVQAMAAPAARIASRPSTPVAAIPPERLRAILAGRSLERLAALADRDGALAPRRAAIGTTRKLLLYRRDLAAVLRNFVNFQDFYGRLTPAAFQAGTLYLDGRAFTLCLEVHDPGKHATLAGMAATYLAYCACTRPDGETKTIVAAVTAGDAANIFTGRNGIFYDLQGRDWDATVTKIVPQPVSVREAFWTPYRWLGKTIEDMAAKRAAAAEGASQAKLQGAAQNAVAGVADGKPPAAPGKIEVGTVAAIGVALGSIGVMVTGILAALFGLGVWMPLGLLGLLLLVSGPSMFLAWMKLRRRNLGPILDASGWATNARLRINVPFGAGLTHRAKLPKDSERRLDDPYAARKGRRIAIGILVVVVCLAVLWATGLADGILPETIRFSTLTGAG